MSSEVDEEDDYSWIEELRDWEKQQDEYEQLGLDVTDKVDDEWSDGIPLEIQELLDQYKIIKLWLKK